MFLSIFILTFLLGVGSASAQTCPAASSSITLFGSAEVVPVAFSWSDGYRTKCPTQKLVFPGSATLSEQAVVAVCNGTTDIALISRDFLSTEATSLGGNKYTCVKGGRSVLNCVVAVVGVAVVAKKGGTAATCISLIGGLTTSQLRCIYGNSASNSKCTKWSDVNSKCPATPITITGDSLSSTEGKFFGQRIGLSVGEGYKSSFKSNRFDPDATISNILSDGNMVGYMAFNNYVKSSGTLSLATINGVVPTSGTISGGTYTPLSRGLYMAVANDIKMLPFTKIFISYGQANDALTNAANKYYPSSYFPTNAAQKAACKAALGY